MNTTPAVWDLILDADAIDLENVDLERAPFEVDEYTLRDYTTGERFVIGTATDEDGEPVGYTWTEYDDEWDVSATNTDGTNDPDVALRALSDWVAAHTTD